jgi:hypothetical protein
MASTDMDWEAIQGLGIDSSRQVSAVHREEPKASEAGFIGNWLSPGSWVRAWIEAAADDTGVCPPVRHITLGAPAGFWLTAEIGRLNQVERWLPNPVGPLVLAPAAQEQLRSAMADQEFQERAVNAFSFAFAKFWKGGDTGLRMHHRERPLGILARPLQMQVYYLRDTLREVLWHLSRIESSEQRCLSAWSGTEQEVDYLVAQRDHLNVVRERWRGRYKFWNRKTGIRTTYTSRKTLDKIWLLETLTGMEAPVSEYLERRTSYVETPGSPLRFLVPPVPAMPVVPPEAPPADCMLGIGQQLLLLPMPLPESVVEACFDEMERVISVRLENNALTRGMLGESSESAKWILEHHMVWEALGIRLGVHWPDVRWVEDFKKWVSAHVPEWLCQTLRTLALHLAVHVWEGVFLVEQAGGVSHQSRVCSMESLSMLAPGMLGSGSSTGLDLLCLPDCERKEVSPIHG